MNRLLIENGCAIAEVGPAPDREAIRANSFAVIAELRARAGVDRADRLARMIASHERAIAALDAPDARVYVDAGMYAESVVGGPLLWPRRYRDKLIAATDWTQGADIPGDLQARYASYRAALRNLPETYPDPLNITWPQLGTASAYDVHWNKVTSGTLAEAADAPVYVDPLAAENDALRARIAELEAALSAPVLELSIEPPAEALLEAYPDEDHAALKARIMAEFASLRNALIGQIPMTHEQLDRLVVLEHPKYQSWLQGVTK